MSATTPSQSSRNVRTNQQSGQMQPSQDFLAYLKDYARQKPEVAALWCFGIGFVVGWKLKPW